MLNLQQLSLFTLCATLVCTSHADTLYKWKDAQGVTHYSQMPPKGAAKAMNLKASSGTPAPAVSQSNTPTETTTNSQTTPVQNTPIKLNANDCSALQQTLGTLQSGQRVYESDANGQRAYLNDEQRNERIQRYQQEMTQGCQ